MLSKFQGNINDNQGANPLCLNHLQFTWSDKNEGLKAYLILTKINIHLDTFNKQSFFIQTKFTWIL